MVEIIKHGLAVAQFVPGNLPQYKYFRRCLCGFETRMQTAEAADTQFNSHLMAHNVSPVTFPNEQYDASLGGTVDNMNTNKEWSPFEPVVEPTQVNQTTKTDWKPF